MSVSPNYPQLLKSIFQLYRANRVTRTRVWTSYLSFANFSVLWKSMTFLLASPPYNYTEGEIGLLGLVGTAGRFAGG